MTSSPSLQGSERLPSSKNAKGKVLKAFGNLIEVRFEGHVRQGETAMVDLGTTQLKSEVIEISGDIAKIQVFEDTRGVKLDTPVQFLGDLLEAELGPGLLSLVIDGLQNPLEKVADLSGFFLPRGVYIPSIDRQKKWKYQPAARIGDYLERGETLGSTLEGRFQHRIMVPFSTHGKVKITWTIEAGQYDVEQIIAKGIGDDGREYSFSMLQKWPIKMPLIAGEKIKPTKLMDTGLRIIDTQFPLMKGGSFCTPGPFGAGKTVLQHHLSKYSSVDIVIIVACGERAGEVVEVIREFPHLIDPHTQETLMARTVMICNTSSMPVAARESSVYLGMTIGEYYRQMGLDVLVLADSTSRWAQAMREMSGRLEEIPGEEAFPAYLASRIAEFYERSGVIQLKDGATGSITVGGAVSPAGGNFEEPVTQATLSVVGAFLGLSRQRSDSRRYPAIDPLISWSKYNKVAAKELNQQLEGWSAVTDRAAVLLKESDEISKRMEVVGEEGTPIQDMITYLIGELFDFSYLQQNAFDKEDTYFPIERQVSSLQLFEQIFNAKFNFKENEEARAFFLSLQSQLKNMNYMVFESEHYRQAYAKVQQIIAEKSH